MPIKSTAESYIFIKMKQKQNDNVYFQEPSSICESESIAYMLLYTRLLTASSNCSISQICTRCILDIGNLRIGTELRWLMVT